MTCRVGASSRSISVRPAGVIQQRCCRRSLGQRCRRTSSLASSRSSSRVIPGVCSTIRSATSSVGSPGVARAAQDPQHVELLRRQPVGLDDVGEAPADEVRGPEQAEHRLVADRLERPALANLALEEAGALHGQ